jgi:integrase/recombinase XerD
MKSLQPENPAWFRLEALFRQWLGDLGYSEPTIYYLPNHIREFLWWLEQQGIMSLAGVEKDHVCGYFRYLSQRKHRRRENGALSEGYLNKHIQALRNLARYLAESGTGFLPVELANIKKPARQVTVLTKADIQALYNATEDSILGMRDRAMLGIYYGCGLRRNEGVQLDTGDIMPKKGLVYVRRGKNYRERYVPVSGSAMTDIQAYRKEARDVLLSGNRNKAFFISRKANRASGSALNLRLKKLTEKACTGKEQAGLHTLRHSIATHLLQSGMKLEHISRFLGHRSLEATQIYTHLANENDF